MFSIENKILGGLKLYFGVKQLFDQPIFEYKDLCVVFYLGNNFKL